MNVPVDRYSIAIVALAALLAISVGCNIRFGGSIADNNRLRELQQQSERTIAELAEQTDGAERRAAAAERINREATGIVADALNTTTATGASLARANEIIRKVIATLQNLELLYRGADGSGGGGVDTVGGE